MNVTDKVMKELKDAGYDVSIAIATEAEIKAKAACGQLAIVSEYNEA